jgi:Flagellar protein FliT
MTTPSGKELRGLCEQLLKLAEKEEQAIAADNLEELEACTRRKEEIVTKLREIESNERQNGPSGDSEEVVRLLQQVTARHEYVRERIKAMLGECQDAILEIQTGQQARRAYYRARKKGRERSARLL